MTYDDAVKAILDIPKFAKKTGTDNLKKILKELGAPEKKIKCIHVAGTNGKGSTTMYLAETFRAAGYRTGAFTSPHLVKINERISINGECISDEDFLFEYQHVESSIASMEDVAYPSFFEFIFIMACCYFSRKQVDMVIYETGLGGRLDATNVITPLFSVITSIGLDHMQYLGDTIEKIAYEKAGIIKENIPVCFFSRDEDSERVIKEVAAKRNSRLYLLKSDDIITDKKTSKSIDFYVNCEYYKSGLFSVSSIASYQPENGGLAALTAHILGIEDPFIKEGLMAMRMDARMQRLFENVYLDGAHNPEAISALIKTAGTSFKDNNIRLMFAVANDKDYEEMARLLVTGLSPRAIYITAIGGERRTAIKRVKQCFRSYADCEIKTGEDALGIFTQAKDDMKDGDILLIVGSLYLAGDILSEYNKRVDE